jgi:HAD superfamily hydrolase (TIGR01549 family)
MNLYDGILFDVGGTLVNGEPTEERMLQEKYAELGLEVTLEQVHGAFYRIDRWILEQALKADGPTYRFPLVRVGEGIERDIIQELNAMCGIDDTSRMRERYQQLPLVPRKWVLINPEMRTTLDKLAASGYRLGIVSNWRPGLEDVLASVGLRKYFDPIVSSSSFGFEKPNPELMLHACRKLDVLPSRCLYVGDIAADVACARLAGVDVALVGKDAVPLLRDFGIAANYYLTEAGDVLDLLQHRAVGRSSGET